MERVAMARGKGDPVLHPAGGQDGTRSRIADVVFIHGLGGDAEGTWRHVDSSRQIDSWWPRWIAEDDERLAVWSLDYDAAPSAWLGGAMPLSDRAGNILTRFEADHLGARSLILVCHSLGGLVAKQMLRSAEGDGVSAWQRIGENVAGIVFLATPHAGSRLADYMSGLASIIGGRPTVAVKELEANAAPLRDLNRWFRNYVNKRKLPVLVFFETHNTSGVRVVDATTADPGLVDVVPRAIDADHGSIAKPATREALVHKRVLEFIAEQTSSAGQRSPQVSAGKGAPKGLRVIYYWLDPITMSFLLSSRVESSLHKILGESPIVLPTAALRDAKELVERFGSRADVNSTFLKDSLLISVGSSDPKRVYSADLPKAFLRGVRIYDGTDKLFVPDIDAYRTIKDPNRWPDGYAMFYVPYGDSSWDEQSIIPNMFLWRFARREDLQNYTAKVRAFVDQAAAQRVDDLIHVSDKDAAFVSRTKSGDDVEPDTYFARQYLNNRAVEAMLFAGRNDWPQDFLTIYGTKQICGGDWMLTISPREPFLQIAVLENTSAQAAFPLSAVRVEEADNTRLRPSDANVRWASTSRPFPPGVLLPGEKLVIPLRIDFRRNREEMRWYRYEPALSEEMHAFVCSLSGPVPVEDGMGRIVFSKNPAAFARPVEPKIQAAYGYGHELRLISAVSGNSEVPLRPYDPQQIFMVAGYESGSCPFLYVRYDNEPEPLKIGRVFRLANSAEKSSVYERKFDPSLEELILAEEEAEITHIHRLTLLAHAADGTVLDEIMLCKLSLGFGERISLRPRVKEGVDRYTFVTEGYYAPLNALQDS
jgi:pimeloyl-ACP methyl ester carboxylesterase